MTRRLTSAELRKMFERSKYYPLDIKQAFWAIGYHLRALEADIRDLEKKLQVTMLLPEENKKELQEALTQVDQNASFLAQNRSFLKPSGVTKEQMAHTLVKKRFNSKVDEMA